MACLFKRLFNEVSVAPIDRSETWGTPSQIQLYFIRVIVFLFLTNHITLAKPNKFLKIDSLKK